MNLKIGSKRYDVAPSFLTLVRYRTAYEKSLFTESISDINVLIQLVYCAILGDKDYFHIFKNECLADDSFELSALSFYKELMLKDCPERKKESEEGNSIDELEILALCSIANISNSLLDILNIFQLIRVINKYCDIKNNTQNVKKMSKSDRKGLYQITPEKEKAIEEYLAKQSEVTNIG